MSIPADALRWVEPERLEPGSLWWTPEGQWWLVVQLEDPNRGGSFGLGLTGMSAGKLSAVNRARAGFTLASGYRWLASVPRPFAIEGDSPNGAPLLLTDVGPILWGALNSGGGSWFNLQGEDVANRVDARGVPYIPQWQVNLVREGRPFEAITELFSVDTPTAAEG